MKVRRCPECFTDFPINVTACPSCGLKVNRRTDKHGYAKKNINWKAYLSFVLSLAATTLFIWWAFFKRK